MSEQREVLRGRLLALGFDDVRFAQVLPVGADDGPRDSGALATWLAEGNHADMAWMERTLEKRTNPDLVLPGARSVIMLGVNYWPGRALSVHAARGAGGGSGAEIVPASGEPGKPGERGERGERDEPRAAAAPIWARYALYADYHDTIKTALIAAGREIEQLCGVGERDYRYYVDTGPVLERGWAARAGVGFIGKNAMLISRRFGNWLFLAAILTKVEFPPDEPIRRQLPRSARPSGGRAAESPVAPDGGSGVGLLCGKCTRCQDACPTQAIPRPGVVDARRCISYQTIENRGIIPRELRAGIGTRIYGCDVCLEVCPWNRFAQESRRVLLTARYDLAALSLRDVLGLTPERFAEVFRKTAIKRIKLAGLLRNACVVAGNSGARECLPELVRLAGHESPIVRAHAVWAVQRLDEGERLADARLAERDLAVLAEYTTV